MSQADATQCPDDILSRAIAAARADELGGLISVTNLVGDYPSDSRLRFLQGSLLAGLQRYDDARVAMAKAVAIAPDYAIARFQLGLLELTSGDAAAAQATWRRLDALPSDDPLRVFKQGLIHLIRDEFQAAVERLKEGIALNTENPLLNQDMQLVIERLGAEASAQSDAEPISAAHLLLQRYSDDTTKH